MEECASLRSISQTYSDGSHITTYSARAIYPVSPVPAWDQLCTPFSTFEPFYGGGRSN